MTFPALTEKEFMAQVVKLARVLGWIVFHPYESRRSVHGFPDLTMVRPPRVLFVELKNDKGRLTLAQEHRGKMLGECPDVKYYLWRPSDWDDIVEVLR